MKRIAIALVLSTLLPVTRADAARAFFTAAIVGQRPADPVFRQDYGDFIAYPEIKAGAHFYGDYYLWLAYGFSRKTGHTGPVLDTASRVEQHFVATGVGFAEKLSGPVGYRLELGASWIRFSETALDATFTDTGVGFRIEGGLTCDLSRRIYLDFGAGYTSASTQRGLQDLRVGGLRFSAGAGVRF